VRIRVTPFKSGNLVIRATVVDENGNKVVGSGYVYVYGSGGYAYEMAGDASLSLKLDKREYQQGDTAKALITATGNQKFALVTVEGERLHSAQIVDVSSGSALVELPIRAEHSPTAYVSVCSISDRKFHERSKRLSVDLGAKNLKISIESDKQKYLPGSKAVYTIKTMDGMGEPVPAELSFAVVDESIYRIMEDRVDLTATFYPKGYNRVNTTYSFQEIYLDGGDKAPKNIEIRKRFKDTAYWQPAVRTNAAGEARVEVQLPDNLTSWRATAVGITADTAVGQSRMNVIAAKPLMARLEGPAFFVQQDEGRLALLVTNDSGKDATVKVDLSPTGISLQGDLKQSAQVAQGQTHTFEWNASAKETGTAVIQAKAWIDDKITDGVELRIPVKPRGRLLQEYSAGVARGTASIDFTLREGADPKSGRIRMRFANSIAGPLVDSLDDLVGFPYGCVEQTLSRFIPTVVMSQISRPLGMNLPNEQEIPLMVNQGFERLDTMQNSDGSWGWWQFDQGDEEMTGYVLEGLARAGDAGFSPRNANMVKSAVAWAKERIKKPWTANRETGETYSAEHKLWIDRQARLRRAQLSLGLAMHGEQALAQQALSELSVWDQDRTETVAIAAMAHRLSGNAGASERFYRWLELKAIRTEGMVAWPEEWGVEGTARALQAISLKDPQHPDLMLAVRGLLGRRRGDMWFSTRDTSAAVIALSQYLLRSDELTGPVTFTIEVDGKRVAERTLSSQSWKDPLAEFIIPVTSLKAGKNAVVIKTQGRPVYYTADFRQTVTADEMPAFSTDSDLRIKRAYYRLAETQLEDGTLQVLPSEQPISSAKAGELIKVVLTVSTTRPRQFLMIEDPLPSGVRIQDRGPVEYESDWSWWWTNMSPRDDRMAFFITTLGPGEHKLAYVFRAENPGKTTALPAVVANMYDPEVQGSSGAARFTIEPK
jgi:uncharacterized protein YfaS (alpha-2-macroglobulin family)